MQFSSFPSLNNLDSLQVITSNRTTVVLVNGTISLARKHMNTHQYSNGKAQQS